MLKHTYNVIILLKKKEKEKGGWREFKLTVIVTFREKMISSDKQAFS